MAANLALDDKLIEAARRAGNHKTKKEAVTAALREYVKMRGRLGILQYVGQVDYWPDCDSRALRKRRRPS
jgi:Arc/MetJ family transcription regulator